MAPRKTNRADKPLSKKELFFSILTLLFNQRTCFYGMYAKDQIWLIENARKALYLIANSIELRIPLKKALRTFEVVIPKYIRNNHTHVPSMIERMSFYQGILLELGEDDLLWMQKNTKQLISFIIKVVSNHEKVANWINSYYYDSNRAIAVGDFYINGIGDHSLNLIGETMFKDPKLARLFYVFGKSKTHEDGWWDCISIPCKEQGEKPPMLDSVLNQYDLGVKLTPRIEQRLLEKGVIIDKDLLRSFVDKVEALETLDRGPF